MFTVLGETKIFKRLGKTHYDLRKKILFWSIILNSLLLCILLNTLRIIKISNSDDKMHSKTDKYLIAIKTMDRYIRDN